MFTDMVGYTALGQRNESLSLALVDDQRNLIRPILVQYNGREIKTMGDAFLVEFPDALDAVRCAYDIQRKAREFNVSRPEMNRIHLRVGIHLGDVVETESDISGDAVNIASRIEPIAEDGGVCMTRQVYDQVLNKFELPLASLGEKPLKNVVIPIEVYMMVMPWSEPGATSPGVPKPVVRITRVSATAELGGELDLPKVAKAIPAAKYDPKVAPDLVTFLLKDQIRIVVFRSGKLACIGASSEDEARAAVQEAVSQLGRGKIPVENEPAVLVTGVGVSVFLGRGVDIKSLPERVPDSMYAEQVAASVQGTYNKGGVVAPVSSDEDIVKALREISGLKFGKLFVFGGGLTHVAYCRLDGPFLAQMVRGNDKDGKMLMTGFVNLLGIKSEAQAELVARQLNEKLDRAGLLGKLTPLDKIPQEGRNDPRVYDYFANNMGIWSKEFVPVPSTGAGAQPCYNCLRAQFTYDGYRWIPAEWTAPFKENTIHVVTLGNPPQKVWVCAECGKCVICGSRAGKGVVFRSQPLRLNQYLPTVVFYCKEHEKEGIKSGGIPLKKVSKHVVQAWSNYLVYQRDKLSSQSTPQAKAKLAAVDQLIAENRR